MCLCDQSEASKRCIIFVLSLLAMIFSLGVAVSMGILMYPGFDECLLFVGVRGEALIYGNPHGCNFMIVGHCVIVFLALVMLVLLFGRHRKGFMKRNGGTQNKTSSSNRALQGTLGGTSTYSSHPTALQNWNRVTGNPGGFGGARFSRHYSTSAIVISMLLATFSMLTALICLSGYLISCNELQYETRSQVYGRTTLGTPVRQLSIHCWSLFRDQDFHTRFHYDHLEYSGQWHGQYRGYKHGRIHTTSNSHDHAIGVAEALELSMACAWITTVLWVAIVSLLIHLRKRAKSEQKRELAESLEDARIFASSRQIMDGGFPDPSVHQQPMPLGYINGGKLPMDQVSTISSSSQLIKRPPSCTNSNTSFATPYATLRLPEPSTSGARPSSLQTQSSAGYHLNAIAANQQQQAALRSGSSAPILQQQQLLLSQQMQQMQLLQQQQQNNGSIQYVQLSNGVLVPTNSVVSPTSMAQPASDISTPLLQSQIVAATNQQLQQQQLQISHQLQQAQQKRQLQETQAQQQQQHNNGTAKRDSVRSPNVIKDKSQNAKGIAEEEQTPNSPTAQIQQVDLSKDVGMKCSQI